MSFNSGQWAANVKRISELDGIDSLGVRESLAVATELKKWVGQWGVYESVCVKVARAIVERKISPTRVGEVIETIIARRRRPKDDTYYIPEPGRYFVVSMIQEFAKAGHAWNRRDSKEED